MIKKLRIKFVAVLMVLISLMLGLIFCMTLTSTRKSLDNAAEEALQRSLKNPGFFPERPEDAVGLPYFVLTRDPWGNLQIRGTEYTDGFDEEELTEFWNQAATAKEDSGSIDGYDLRYLRSSSRMITSIAFVDVTSQRLTMQNLIRSSLIIGAVSLVTLFAVAVLLAHWITRPVEKAWQQQRQFVADASHELKTPLTVIMTNAELLHQADSENQAYTGGILTMSRQMRSLVEGLLELARVDNGAVKIHFTLLNFSLLVSDGILPFEPMYFERELLLESAIQEGVCVRGSVPHLQQVVEILLDNAMKYSTAPGQVRLTLQRQGNHALLTVENTGEPIAPEDRKRIFERFYRADKARCQNGSFGLGLSIAERIVTEHRGKIWAESSGGINRFCVQLPIG